MTKTQLNLAMAAAALLTAAAVFLWPSKKPKAQVASPAPESQTPSREEAEQARKDRMAELGRKSAAKRAAKKAAKEAAPVNE